MAKQFSVQDFFKRFPDDDACLNHLMAIRFGHTLNCPKCGKMGKFSRIRKMPAFQCAWCGHHIHPMVDTPFENSRTSLQKWFYAMYLFTTTRNGVSAKELERQLGVTYKTAWRMGHQIRMYMTRINNSGSGPLKGHVEVDESFFGGRHSNADKRAKKTIVLNMAQRDGEIISRSIPDTRRETIDDHIEQHIMRGSTVSTDKSKAYGALKRMGYDHGSVNHSMGQYADGIHHVNTVEGFWSLVNRSIRGTHVYVSQKYMDNYLAEFSFRFNLRKNPAAMMPRLLVSF